MSIARTIYDDMPYRSQARTATHIDRLAALGRLLALPTAHPNASRVLELGCGDGGNVIPMALSLPGSEFLGCDLASTAIERGREAVAATSASNVSLFQRDIAGIGPEVGDFDYIIAHGIYSWVPPEVRAAVLRVVRERLRANGIAFISYNALPGDHIRGVVRQMMRMHTSHIVDPSKKLEQARGLLALLAQVPGEAGDVYRPLLQSEIGRALQTSDELLFHDDLADISQPFFFTEFMNAAQGAGLQFACEAVFHSMNIDALPGHIADLLRELSTRDLIAKEQYLDFMTCRGFRQTLLCHAEAPLRRDIDLARIRQFRWATEAKLTTMGDGTAKLEHRNGSSLRTGDPALRSAFGALTGATPRSVAFDVIAREAGAADEGEQEALASALYQAFAVGLLDIRLFEPEFTTELSERPRASSWARHRASTGRAANLYHEVIELDDVAQALLPLADGTRTIAELATDIGADDARVTKSVAELARLALIVA